MRGFGILAIIVGVIVVFGAMAMDVSVSTGMGGRVNNIGLMAQQQNFIIVGGLITLGGILLMLFGSKKQVSAQQLASTWEAKDSRPCPFCAEPIKHAAIKCKHCGADVDAVERETPAFGWTVRLPCRSGDEFEATRTLAEKDSLPLANPDGSVVVIGPYQEKEEAVEVLRHLRTRHSIFGELLYEDGR